jgi:hypothetical protein
VAVAQDQVKADQTATVVATVTGGGGDFSGVRVLLSTAASHVDLDVPSCGKGAALSASHGCGFDGVKGESVTARQSFTLASKYVKKKTPVTVTASVVQDGKTVKSGGGTVVFTPLASPSPTPSSPKPTKPGKPSDPPVKSKPTSKSPSPTKSTTGTGGGNGGGNNNTTVTGNRNGYVPPNPNGSFDGTKSPQVALPPITGGNAPSPSVATPDTSLATPQSTLRANKAPVAQEMAFQRVASTQIAWLAALLVAFSLLLTQLRLGRRPAAPGASAGKHAKGGAHRRPRKGTFGK